MAELEADATAAPYAQLAFAEHDALITNRFYGTAVLVRSSSEYSCAAGPIDEPVLAFDALKPLQTVAAAMAGADLAFNEWPIAAANHTGTLEHVRIVRQLLDRAELNEGSLMVPATLSSDPRTHAEQLRELVPAQRIFNPSSGTHAAMLLACVNSGWPIEGYNLPEHPLQIHTREVIERLTGAKAESETRDTSGCASWGFSLTALVRAYAKLGTASSNSPFAMHRAAGSMIAATHADPWAIAGDGQVDTVLNRLLPVFIKSSDNGYLFAAGSDGSALGIRTLDGSAAPLPLVALRLMSRHGMVEVADAAKAAHLLPSSVSVIHDSSRIKPVLN